MKMLKEKAGETAGKIWNALNGTEGMAVKQLKKRTKLIDKDLYLVKEIAYHSEKYLDSSRKPILHIHEYDPGNWMRVPTHFL